MNRSHPPSPMIAHESDAAGTAGSRAARAADSPLPPEAEPGAVVEEILGHLGKDQYQTARRLAAEALARFPEHPRVQNAWRIFDKRANAVRGQGNEPSRSEEFDWLKSPPESARGKWVALVGKEMVAAADTLAELVEALKSLSLPKPPLVHQLD